MKLSAAHQAWVEVLRDTIGGTIAIADYVDQDGTTTIPIITCKTENGMFVSTIGLMELSQTLPPAKPMSTELMIERSNQDATTCNLLASAAFHVMKKGWKVHPGVVFENLVSMSYPKTNLPHLFFTVPYQGDGLDMVELGDRTIYPLLAIPVSEAESQLARTERGAKLEEAWESKRTDVLDWQRASVV